MCTRAGINPWHWNTWTKGLSSYYSLGASEFPAVVKKLHEIGAAIGNKSTIRSKHDDGPDGGGGPSRMPAVGTFFCERDVRMLVSLATL